MFNVQDRPNIHVKCFTFNEIQTKGMFTRVNRNESGPQHDVSHSFLCCFLRGVLSLGVQNLHIQSLGLRSLRSVSGGLVLLHNNSKLCYTESLSWVSLLHPTQGPHYIINNNQDPNTCGK